VLSEIVSVLGQVPLDAGADQISYEDGKLSAFEWVVSVSFLIVWLMWRFGYFKKTDKW
jgi:hypothetical protein|tara:strand:+ start:492 stop:665 length:174 start_codon:yes stop_codon:yes gene_type:complete